MQTFSLTSEKKNNKGLRRFHTEKKSGKCRKREHENAENAADWLQCDWG